MMSDGHVARLQPEPGRLATLRVASERFRRERNASSSVIERLTARSSRLFASYHFQFPPRWRVELRAFPSTANRAKPDFVSIGPVRSGTSALANYIFQHPCVALPFAKEISGRKEGHYLAQMPTKKEMRRK